MQKLSPAALIAANKVHSEGAWIFLLEIQLKDGDVIRLARNNEDIQWNGELWQAFPFGISESKSDDKGTLTGISIEVDNTTRDLEDYLQSGAGGTGVKVILRCVVSTALDVAEPEFEEYFSVKQTDVNERSVKFTLGSGYPVRARRPYRRYMKNNCPFQYKGVKCGCTSSLASCNHTLADCRERNNAKRFGGFVGIPQGGLYV